MDPVTGVVALAGITLASIAGLRLKKNAEENSEGFVALPERSTHYQNSVQESQSRYNLFSQMINPITNSVIPVGSSSSTVQNQKDLVNGALGTYSAEFSPDSSQTVVLKTFENQFKPRSDNTKSLYGAMKFCREAGKKQNPFTTYNSDGSVKMQGAVSADGHWKFDEVCGVCLTSGVDEEGNRFRKTQGMVVEPSLRDSAIDEQKTNGWAYPRIGPSLGTCEGAPNNPVFATNAIDLARYRSREACLSTKSIGGSDNCALCYDSDNVFSSVKSDTQLNPIYFVLQGTGNVTLKLKGATLSQKQLSDSSPVSMELVNAKEGDTFILEVSSAASTESTTNIYGYLQSKTPRDGLFTMPLNLLVTVDDETGASPSKTGGFYTFESIGLDVAKMRPGSGKTTMRLRGVLPFTFVQSSEFSAMDCLDAPFQTKASSASAFSTDQPCFAKGAKPGNYNEACLRQRILDAGCTNAGDLYKNPLSLNAKDGKAQSISQIYNTLQQIASEDMLDPNSTKLCSGRTISTPCDPFILQQGTLKFAKALTSTNPTVKTQAQQCLSFIYHNRGASETANPPRVGPTYTGLVTYSNNQRDIKNIYCLPEGALNPDTNQSAVDTLARVADNGYGGRVGVDAIKKFLNDQLSVATDSTRDASGDPDRKAAINNCFGTNVQNLPPAVTGAPRVVADAAPQISMVVSAPTPAPQPMVFPAGFTPGLFVRFYAISDANPDITPGNRGWGERLGTPNAYGSINFNNNTLPRTNKVAMVAKGYYVAPRAERLQIYTDSDDGVYVTFNNRQIISNWRIHASARDTSAPITIPSAGTYPFEIRFYQYEQGATCKMFFRVDDEQTWRSDLSSRFAYKPTDVATEESEYQAQLRSRQTASLASVTSNTRLRINHPDGRSIKNDNGVLRLNRGTEITFDISNRSDNYKASSGNIAILQTGTQKYLRHSGLVAYLSPFAVNNGDFSWRIVPNGNGYYIKNEFAFTPQRWFGFGQPDLSSILGYDAATDTLKLMSYNTPNSWIRWSITPKPGRTAPVTTTTTTATVAATTTARPTTTTTARPATTSTYRPAQVATRTLLSRGSRCGTNSECQSGLCSFGSCS